MSLRTGVTFIILITLFSCNRQAKTDVEPPFNYTLTGKGDTTIIFVHGLAINKTYWNQQIEAFKSNYTVVSFDFPGHGASNVMRNEWGVDDYANDVVQLAKSLHLGKIILVGHSMSGTIDLLAYEPLKENVVGFIGVDNFQELGEPMSDSVKKAVDDQLQEFYKHYKTTAAEYAQTLFSPRTDSAIRKRVTGDFVNSDSLMVVQLLSSIMEQSQFERERLKDLTIPLILIDSDMYPVNEQLLTEYCGGGYKIWTIPGTGHYPMVEKPAEFNKALAEALEYIRHPKK